MPTLPARRRRGASLPWRRLHAGALCALSLAASSAAQESGRTQEPLTLEELRRRLEELERSHDREREDLLFEIEALQDQIDALQRGSTAESQRANVFNPAITVFGNFLGRWDDTSVFLEDDPAEPRIDDRFNLREVELDLRAAIDPWADGVLIAAWEAEEPNEYEAVIEEGYVVVKKLPIADAAPGGLQVKAGKFRAEFGRFNRIHLHDLPQPTYPKSLGTFLGEEGYAQNGLSGQFFLPAPSDAQSLQATIQVLTGGDIEVADDQDGSEIATLGHLAWFADLGGGHDVELGLSGWTSDSDHRLYGADATYRWKPFAGGEWRSFLLGGELFAADLEDPALDDSPLGWYVWSQVQFTKNLYAGVRYDVAEELDDESLETRTIGGYVTYYTTEFLRTRLGVEHAESDVDLLDDRDTLFFELNFVFGSHPVEPYWVNR